MRKGTFDLPTLSKPKIPNHMRGHVNGRLWTHNSAECLHGAVVQGLVKPLAAGVATAVGNRSCYSAPEGHQLYPDPRK